MSSNGKENHSLVVEDGPSMTIKFSITVLHLKPPSSVSNLLRSLAVLPLQTIITQRYLHRFQVGAQCYFITQEPLVGTKASHLSEPRAVVPTSSTTTHLSIILLKSICSNHQSRCDHPVRSHHIFPRNNAFCVVPYAGYS